MLNNGDVIMNNGLPFSVSIPSKPLIRETMTGKEINPMLVRGFDEANEANLYDADKFLMSFLKFLD